MRKDILNYVENAVVYSRNDLLKVIAAEREACAFICECLFVGLGNTDDIRDMCAEAIRGRND